MSVFYKMSSESNSSNSNEKTHDSPKSTNTFTLDENWMDLESPPNIKYPIHRPIGVSTIASTMSKKCMDLKSPPPKMKYKISPWTNSSIDPDSPKFKLEF